MSFPNWRLESFCLPGMFDIHGIKLTLPSSIGNKIVFHGIPCLTTREINFHSLALLSPHCLDGSLGKCLEVNTEFSRGFDFLQVTSPDRSLPGPCTCSRQKALQAGTSFPGLAFLDTYVCVIPPHMESATSETWGKVASKRQRKTNRIGEADSREKLFLWSWLSLPSACCQGCSVFMLGPACVTTAVWRCMVCFW